MSEEVMYMRRVIQLASWGLGTVSFHPLTAWIIVKNNQILGEGWLQGEPFISTFIQSIANVDVKNSHLYMNINPVTAFGKQGVSFLDILRQQQIQGLYLPEVTHSKYGVKVNFYHLPLLQEEAQWLNRRHFTWNYKKRPYIILKWAETADGFIARLNNNSKWISNAHSRKLVHQWRSQEDAIMVGTNTCRYDNPRLNVRDWSGRNPVRVILDRKLRLNTSLHVFDHTQPTICFNQIKTEHQSNLEYVKICEDNQREFMQHLLLDLHKRKLHSLFVEGGARLLTLLIQNGWWDEARIFQSKVLFKEGIKAPKLDSEIFIAEENISGDRLLIYQKLNKK